MPKIIHALLIVVVLTHDVNFVFIQRTTSKVFWTVSCMCGCLFVFFGQSIFLCVVSVYVYCLELYEWVWMSVYVYCLKCLSCVCRSTTLLHTESLPPPALFLHILSSLVLPAPVPSSNDGAAEGITRTPTM